MLPGDKNAIVAKCISAIDDSRQQFAGNPTQLRRIFRSAVSEMVESILGVAKSEKIDISVSVTYAVSRHLLSIARNGAISGVRESNVELIAFGLVALAMENLANDPRETIIELTLLDCSTRKIGCELNLMFDDIRPFCTAEFTTVCDTFFRKGWRSLEAIGYCEGEDKQGRFRYRQNW